MPEPELIVDGETGEVMTARESAALARVESRPPATAHAIGGIAVRTPAEVLERATEIAASLSHVIERQKLYDMIGRGENVKKHIRIEGWHVLSTLANVRVRERAVERQPDGTWTATVEIIAIRGGEECVIGEGSSMCSPTEPRQQSSAPFQVRSMAITRATSRAYRACLGWVVHLAGYSPEPPDAAPEAEPETRPRRRAAAAPPPVPKYDRDRLVAAFAAVGVTTDELESWALCSLTELEPDQQAELRRIYAEIACAPGPDRERVIRQYFPVF